MESLVDEAMKPLRPAFTCTCATIVLVGSTGVDPIARRCADCVVRFGGTPDPPAHARIDQLRRDHWTAWRQWHERAEMPNLRSERARERGETHTQEGKRLLAQRRGIQELAMMHDHGPDWAQRVEMQGSVP